MPSRVARRLRGASPEYFDPLATVSPGRIIDRQYSQLTGHESPSSATLLDRLFDVYQETMRGVSRSTFKAIIHGSSGCRLALYYGANRELAGFAFSRLEHHRYAGRKYAVLVGGAFFRLRYKNGGELAARYALFQALRCKLREPCTPLVYFTRALSPPAYRRLAAGMPRVYPSRHGPTPPRIEALVRKLSELTEFEAVSRDLPWVVHAPAVAAEPQRLQNLKPDPDISYYHEINPGYAQGDALLVLIPLNLRNIAGGFCRALRAHIANRMLARASRRSCVPSPVSTSVAREAAPAVPVAD